MSGLSYISPNSRCFGCLSSNTEKQLELYYLKKLICRTILQMEHLVLCCMCKRVAVQTEKFIHNVETSQALFENYKNDPNFSADYYKTIIHPLVNLTHWKSTSKDIIECHTTNADQDTIKDEFGDFSEHFTDNIEIKKEEETHENYQTESTNIAQGNTTTIKHPELKTDCRRDSFDAATSYYGGDAGAHDEDDFKYVMKEVKTKKTNDYCAKVFDLTKEQLMEERSQRVTEKKYLEAAFKCENCIKGFVMKTPFENHMKLHDKKRGKFECDVCKQRLKTKVQLELHYRYHIERYKCAECDETRNCFMSLKDHYLRKHKQGHYEYSCPVCFKQFRFRSSLQKHKSDKHENRERIKCKYCEKTFASESAIGYHLKFNHTEEESATLKRHTCVSCGRSFKQLQKLKTHMTTHSARRDHYCVECDKSFKTRTALNLHFKTVAAHNTNKNGDLQEYSCPHCEKRFPQKKGLTRHISNVHLNQTLLQCSQCGKTFKSKKRLMIHIMSHSEGYEQLKKHCCNICNKRFYEKGVLAKHMNTHTGDKPFQCGQCPARFAHSGSLYNHVKLVHLRRARGAKRNKQTT